MTRYRVILQERRHLVYIIDADDADDAVATVDDAVAGGFREALDEHADDEDGRTGLDELNIWAEDIDTGEVLT